MRIADSLREAAQTLAPVSDTARLDAELLMAHALGVSRSDLLLRHMDDAPPASLDALVARRLGHEPIAYIVGHREFYGLDFRVSPAVLIPRPDSETLVEAALAARPDARSVLDCGTGSGALLLAVLANLPAAQGTGIDISPDALEIARANAVALGLDDRARMVCADWNEPGWSDLPGAPFDLVLANPPYVENDAELGPSVSAYEPSSALFAGPGGLDAYQALVPQLPGLLAPGGHALIEIGMHQEEEVSRIARESGFAVRLHRDLGERPRVLELT
ncbi:MAG: peptide chain release factor N(5)-glutamine methyltransferase [Novosphingobium sp.]|nr:peptide chain release factor N(5)-glutamine methyltransferase [Novosphingobium sp.]MCP5401627.1 peptide chain release factor N(5)-glutamine methyltransferase [Novosphingobium sp.]